jgi:hypothetical protein
MKILLVLLALTIGIPGQAFAEGLAPGTRVRVTLIERQDAPLVGTLLALPPAALEIRVEPDSSARTILRPDIARLEVSGGMRSRAARGAVRGAIIVGGLGALGGFILGSMIRVEDSPETFAGIGAAGGVLLGAGLGAITTEGRYERWRRVPLPDPAP